MAEIIHRCPEADAVYTPCCHKNPFNLPRDDRLTADPALVTCRQRLFSEAAWWLENSGQTTLALNLLDARDQLERYQKALAWYANQEHYHPNGSPMTPFVDGDLPAGKPLKDFGLIAREALGVLALD